MQSKFLIALWLIWSMGAIANEAGGKRTILTSGEKVHPIYFRLGQSTILYLGFKPETVICGNKNYFNIEKIKEGVTIQPLANFATNLSILDKDRRYLLYLAPAGGRSVDSFIDLRWIPEAEALPIERLVSARTTRMQEIGQRLQLNADLELVVLRQKVIGGSVQRIFELELSNQGRESVRIESIVVTAMAARSGLRGQVIVWKDDSVKSKSVIKGRLILQKAVNSFELVLKFKGRETRTSIKGAMH